MDLGYDPADTCTEVWMSRVTGAAPKGYSFSTATHLYIYSLVALLYIRQVILQQLQDSLEASAHCDGTKAPILHLN